MEIIRNDEASFRFFIAASERVGEREKEEAGSK